MISSFPVLSLGKRNEYQTQLSGILILLQALTVRQIYRISTMYWDDKYGTQSVSNEASCIFSSFVVLVDLFSGFTLVSECCLDIRWLHKWERFWTRTTRIWHPIHSCWMMIWGGFLCISNYLNLLYVENSVFLKRVIRMMWNFSVIVIIYIFSCCQYKEISLAHLIGFEI